MSSEKRSELGMVSNEQKAAEEEKKISELKNDCLETLRDFHAAKEECKPVEIQIKLYRDWAGKCDRLFNYVESCVATSDLLGANRSEFWAQEMANTASNLLDVIPVFYEKLWFEAGRLNLESVRPSPNAFTAMQNAVAVYNPDQVQGFKGQFERLGLPVRGFTHSVRMNTMYDRWEKWVMFFTIVLFVALLLVIAVFKKEYPPEGFFIIRVVLALFAAAFAAVAIPGFLKVKFKIKKGITVQAAGAVAVFTIVYLLNPPSLVTAQKNSIDLPPIEKKP